MATRIEELAVVLKSGTCVLFTGAGVGVRGKLLDWGASLRELAEIIGEKDPLVAAPMKGLVERRDMLSAATMPRLSSVLTRKERLAALLRVYGREGEPALIRPIIDIPFFAYTTTNYDTLIQRAYGRYITCFKCVDMDLRAALGHEGPYVMQLHGSVEMPDSIVFDRDDYAVLASSEHYQTYLRQLLQEHPIVFVGYSFRDPDIDELLKYLGDHLTCNWGRDAYALLRDSETELAAQLQKYGVRVVTFGSHDLMWEFFETVRRQAPPSGQPEPGQPALTRHIDILQRNLGAAMAHIQLVESGSSLPSCVSAGIVATAIADAGGVGHKVASASVIGNVRDVLYVKEGRARDIYNQAIGLLLTLDAVEIAGDDIALKRPIGTVQLDRVREKLAVTISARADVRLGQRIVARPELGDFVIHLLAAEGVGLAHSVIGVRARRSQETIVIEAKQYADRALRSYSPLQREVILRTVLAMLNSPTKDEDVLLTKLARCVFTTEIVLHEPTLSSLTGFATVNSMYLDSNVLLPLLLRDHPFHPLHESILKAASGRGITVLAYQDFIVEVCRHRELALDLAKSEALKTPADFRRYADMWGASGINTFIGAYAESKMLGANASFQQFLVSEAPYTTPAQLEGRLNRMGISVARELRNTSYEDVGRLGGGLQAAYDGLESKKPPVLVMDEARQMAVLLSSVRHERPCWFVTADKKLVRAVELAFKNDKIWGSVLSLLVSPVECAQYLELAGAKIPNWTGYARFVWGMLSSDLLTRMLDMLTDTVIRDYRAVNLNDLPGLLAKAKHDLSRHITPDIADGSAAGDAGRMKLFAIFDTYAKGFYESLQAKKGHGQ